jgi:DNA repair exonuclease SbcCD nuclease subunit
VYAAVKAKGERSRTSDDGTVTRATRLPPPLADPHAIRILFLADSHLGFDMPLRPRVERRRRGPDFFRNLDLALRPALEKKVDLVIHGGDLFFRSRVGPGLVMQVRERIRAVAESGVPILIVPGNHERSALPLPILWRIPGLFVFDRPRTYRLNIRERVLGLSGFPCRRRNSRGLFPALIEASHWRDQRADIRLLCMHQTVEGATVGPGRFTFRNGPDVIPGRLVPRHFAAVLSGHIHRHQVLREELCGKPLSSPVLYPGSTERTSFAERCEAKGYLILDLRPSPGGRGSLESCTFVELPARPMVQLDLEVSGLGAAELEARLRQEFARLHPDSIVRMKTRGSARAEVLPLLRAAALRRIAPATMSVEIRPGEGVTGRQSGGAGKTLSRLNYAYE